MSLKTQTFTETLVVETCGECHITFGMTVAFRNARLADHKSFWCPRGDKISYLGKTEEQRQRERADLAERRLRNARESEEFYREQARHERRVAAAHKGHATRIRNMVAQGVCPVPGCHRSFINVRRHMATQHPDYHLHDEVAP